MRDSRMLVRSDARAGGMVTSQTVRYSERWKGTSDRAIGVAPGADPADGPSVRVRNLYDPTVNEVRPVSSFRAERISTKAAKVTEVRQTEVERFGLVNNIGQDYS